MKERIRVVDPPPVWDKGENKEEEKEKQILLWYFFQKTCGSKKQRKCNNENKLVAVPYGSRQTLFLKRSREKSGKYLGSLTRKGLEPLTQIINHYSNHYNNNKNIVSIYTYINIYYHRTRSWKCETICFLNTRET